MFLTAPLTGAHSALLMVASFVVNYLIVRFFSRFLPRDRGRELAFEGDKSRGKFTSTGILFVTGFAVLSIITLRLPVEIYLYVLAILFEMVMGFLDDNARKPWGELRKGVMDFIAAAFVAGVYLYFNGNTVLMPLLGVSFALPAPIMFVLIVLLVWAAINVTNITDGVDGLSATLGTLTLLSFLVAGYFLGTLWEFQPVVLVFLGALLCYLWFNVGPGTHLMGDAGSRAMGALFAITALKLRAPFLFIPFALVFVLDGGSSLVKLTVLRTLKIKGFMQNIRTPLHDHVRKKMQWSDAQTVLRFAIIQGLVSFATLMML